MKQNTKYENYRDGRLKIRKRSSVSYQGKIYLTRENKQSKFIYKSIKTDDKRYAVEELQNWCDEVQYLQRNEKPLPVSNQKNIFIEYSKDYIKNFDRKDNATHKDDKKYHEHLMTWIKKEKIKQVNRKSLQSLKDDYLTKITESDSTRNHWFNYIRKVFRYQLINEMIIRDDIPEFPKLSTNAGKRIFLDHSQYRHLVSVSIERMNKPKLARRMQLYRKILNRFIIFQCATGMRPSETYRLKWNDITVKRNDKDEKFLSIEVHQGKTKKSVRTVISKPPAVDAIKQLKEVYLEYSDILNKEKVDRNIIFPFNQSQSNLTLLKSADLYEDKEMKKKRDVYTYRHTYISWSVLKGSALFNIAKNCGTSVAMIEKHYANNLTSVHFQNVLSTLKI